MSTTDEIRLGIMKGELKYVPGVSVSPEEFAFQSGVINEASIAVARQKMNECYHKIIKILSKYIDMSEEQKKIITIWVIGTYFHEQFNTYPYLFFNAMRGSGKTRTLKLISALGAKGDGSVQNNLTEAVLFRIPRGTTTCIDEIEQIGSKEKQTLREILNSAYKKGMKIKRMKKRHTKEGEEQIVETFEPYFPICMANIWGMDEVLGDRSLTLVLEKSNHPSITKMIEDFDINPDILDVKRTLKQVSVVSVVSLSKKTYTTTWNEYICNKYNDTTTLYTYTTQNDTTTLLNKIEVEELFNKIDSSGIHGRNFELTFPLLLIAKEVGEGVFDDILKVVSKQALTKKEDEYTESKDVSLYELITTLEGEVGLNMINIKELTSRFRNFLGDTDDEDRWLNDKWVGRALKRLNLILDKKRMASGRLVRLNFNKAKEKLKIFKGHMILKDEE